MTRRNPSRPKRVTRIGGLSVAKLLARDARPSRERLPPEDSATATLAFGEVWS